ncbi:HK97-gp10 family putative phage morphogenesis protein [Gluconacetobacter diazotrophicus]|uniref:hypothetical protein n=1 Tax=Gluconacetobacter diazotrophicus TaxID=33996 RepID=UPI00119EE990|nr:hypothetical protein [Gluconacetobacter diazotrophicus]
MANINIAVSNEAYLQINKARITTALRLIVQTIKADVVALLRSSHITSSPGEAPGMRSGALSRSIVARVQNNRKGVSVTITSTMKYALALEAGSDGPGKRHMDPRPFLSKVIDQRKDWISQTLADAIYFNFTKPKESQ